MADGNFNLDFQTALVGSIVTPSETNGNIEIDGEEVTVYSLPTAASNVLGGVKIGSGLAINDGVVSVTGKQDTLTFDDSPTENSTNPVKSGGVYVALQTAGSNIIEYTDQEASALVTAIEAILDKGLMPVIVSSGKFLRLDAYTENTAIIFSCTTPDGNGDLLVDTFEFTYSSDTWSVTTAQYTVDATIVVPDVLEEPADD